MRAVGISTVLVLLGVGCGGESGAEVAEGSTSALEAAQLQRYQESDAGAASVDDESLALPAMQDDPAEDDQDDEDEDAADEVDEMVELLEELSGPSPDMELDCPRGELGENLVQFDCEGITVLTCKDLSNVVLELDDGRHARFEGLSGHVNTFEAPGAGQVVGVWVKAGNNHSGAGPGYGERFDAPEDSCESEPEDHDEGCGGVCQPNEGPAPDAIEEPGDAPVDEPAGEDEAAPCPYATEDESPCYG